VSKGLTRLKVWGRLAEGPVWLATRHTWLTLVVAAVVTALAALVVPRIEIRSDLMDLLPEDTPNVVRIHQVKKTLGYSASLNFLVGSPDPEATLRFATDLAAALDEDPSMGRIDFRRDISFFEKNALLYLSLDDLEQLYDRIEARIQRGIGKKIQLLDDDEEEDGQDGDKAGDEVPTIESYKKKYGIEELEEYRRSPDGTIVSIQCKPTVRPEDMQASRALLDRADEIIAKLDPKSYHPEMTLLPEGSYHKKFEDTKTIPRDLSRSGMIAGGLILFFLLAVFRRLRAIPLVLLALGCAIVWTFGIVWAAIGYLNIITAFIFALLLGLGIDFAIHVISRYREQRAAGDDLEQALRVTLVNLGGALGTAALTTSATFFSLTLFDFRGFSQFGFIAGIGVLLCMVSAFVLLPALVSALEKIRPERFAGRAAGEAPSARTFPRRVAIAVAALAALATVAAAVGIPRIEFEYDFRNLGNPPRPKPELKQRYSKEVSKRTSANMVVITESMEETRLLDRELARWDKNKPGTYFRDWISVFRAVPEEQEERLELIEEISDLVERKIDALEGRDRERAEELQAYLDPEPFELDDLPAWFKDLFRDAEGRLGRFLTIFAGGSKSEARDVEKIISEMGVIETGGKKFHSSASFFILWDVVEVIHEEGPRAVALALLVVLLILALDLRSWRGVLFTVGPLALGVLWMCGVMGLTGFKLNMFNIVVLPTILGIGVDNSVHVYHRYIEEGPGSAGRVLRTTGLAATVASITTAAGFAGMLIAENRGLASIGQLALIGIGTCLFTSVAGLLAALALKDRKPNQGGQP